MKNFLKLIRVHHYLKNLLIMLPFVFGKQLFNTDLWLKIIPGFASFCFITSVIYIFNDIKDLEKDKLHHTKCHRPIASGAISVKSAIVIAIIFFVLSFGINILTFSHWYSFLLLGLYFVLNILYTIILKNIPILDICVLVSGFFLRVVYGSIITDIVISNWMYLTIMSLSFYLALGKRRNEMTKTTSSETRSVLKFYNHAFLDKFMYLCLTITIVFYSLWCTDPSTIANLGNRVIWTTPFVIALCMKYSLIVEGDSDGDPISVILKDKILLLMALAFCVSFACFIYL